MTLQEAIIYAKTKNAFSRECLQAMLYNAAPGAVELATAHFQGGGKLADVLPGRLGRILEHLRKMIE